MFDLYKCCICGGNNRLYVEDTYACSSCSHIFRNLNNADNLYESGQYRKEHPVSDINNRVGKIQNLLKIIDSYVSSNNTILDIGSGDGILAQELINLGKMVSCCELDPFISNNYHEKINIYIGDFTLLDIPRHDIIIGLDVLEHIKNPALFVKKCNCKYLILQVPINRKMRTPKTKPDGHYHYFSKSSISYLLNDNGFTLDSVEQYNGGILANGEELLVISKRA